YLLIIKFIFYTLIKNIIVSLVYSMFDETRRNVSIVLIKKLCDGLDMTLEEFFSSEIFNKLEQKIK
ncbi:hypothetical protein, partial [Monoglobus pectinilyticus]|uniref:hypothetical protein n=1 Tax=Monoglobus pectinilyticus TaxID=1981510 RepID=UPI003AB615A5